MPKREWQQWGVPAVPPTFLTDPDSGQLMDDSQRSAVLDWAVNQCIATGWRVESRSTTQAVLVRGEPVNHAVHAILTIFTCLLWGIVWIALAAGNKVERLALTVDHDGHIQAVQGPG